MKWYKIISLSAILLFIFSVADNCKQVTGALDDQTPLLIVNVEITNDPTNIITISDTQKVYLIYYADNDWTNPWLMQSSTSNTIFNPVVGTFSTHIAVFWDGQGSGIPGPGDGNGSPDAGEPCIGYENADHSALDLLTPLTFIPLQWRAVTLTLDPAIVY
jgi:hypothetical protein